MNRFILSHKESLDKVISHTHEQLNSLRIGRAHPGLVEGVFIEAYGNQMTVKQVANIKAQDNRTLVIEPWDKSLVKAIETGLTKAELGALPNVDGTIIRLSIPQPTEERRLQLVKLMKEHIEENRVALRNIREKIREEINDAEKNKEISEDEKFKYLKDVDEVIKEHNATLAEISESKEKEIMTV